MGRKRLYHTEEDQVEAKRRNRMRWYDRNRHKILKAYKSRESNNVSTSVLASTSKPDRNAALARKLPPNLPLAPVAEDMAEDVAEGTDSGNAPQTTELVSVMKEKIALEAYMQGTAETFCVRVAEEVLATLRDDQLDLIKTYMESVASFVDRTRPNVMALWNMSGRLSEWKEAKKYQNGMSIVIQYLDEIHHHTEVGDLADAMSINLLSFQ